MSLATRTAYRDHLVRMMADDPRIVCLDTDTGLFAGVDFGAAASRYVNLGIAEQNLMGMAAGLAASGWRPYVNTMATFASTRAVEAVKVDIAYNALPVRIVATHAGVSAGHLGPTHHCLEDLAVMRTLPNMTVVVPGDAPAVPDLLTQLATLPGPAYVRLGRKATPDLPAAARRPLVGQLQTLLPDGEVLIVSCGPQPTLRALAAAELLSAGGPTTPPVAARVVQAHTVQPFDVDGLLRHAADVRLVVTVEEHWRTGGLGSTVAEILAERLPRRLLRLALPDAFVATVGSPDELLDHAGLSPEGIAAAITAAETDNGGRTNGQLPRV
ncbi:transketolase family protein [Micromonospora sp. DT229]|uniref:transketolase family protein n=1 Tax=Micromonospora sp. DT229 TaxID=3393430 RepID=UPI003CF95204